MSPRLSTRASGILLHPTSLAGPPGAGDLGAAAHRFVELLARAHQTWWQMLPVGPAGRGSSPYQARSTFAGDPRLVGLEALVRDGLLDVEDVAPPARAGKGPGRANHAASRRYRVSRLRKAFRAFEARRRDPRRARFEAFREENEAWLADWALFSALRRAHRGRPWPSWDADLRLRRRPALVRARRRLDTEILFHEFVQWLFDRQWSSLRRKCHRHGIGLLGDVPMFVAADSADTWANQEIFQLDVDGRPAVVAGVPPDAFSRTGQVWGNPVYRWDVLRARGYDWWIERLRAVLGRFDAVRLDHFIGFCRYFRIPAGERTARDGRYVNGPGASLLRRVHEVLRHPALVAEDLGRITPRVEALRDEFGLPGMRVLQFAFETDGGGARDLPHNYPRRCVVYTGTHDNDTTVGWFRALGSDERRRVLRYAGGDGREIHWDLARLAFASVADVAILPMQDVLGLGSKARTNRPGRALGNWAWRMTEGSATDEVVERLAQITHACRRAPLLAVEP